MSDVAAIREGAPQRAGREGAKRSNSVFAAAYNNRPLRILGFIIVSASVLMSSISFLILTGATDIEPSASVWTIIWVVTGVLVLLVLALVVTEAALLIQARMQRQAGAGMQIRMVAMFALVAAIPDRKSVV